MGIPRRVEGKGHCERTDDSEGLWVLRRGGNLLPGKLMEGSQPPSERRPYDPHFASCNSDKICNQPDLQPDLYNDRAILAVRNVVVDELNGFLSIVSHAVRLVDMEHHSIMSAVNTNTKGAGRDHFRLPTDPFLEETAAEREGGASVCRVSHCNIATVQRSFIFRIQLFPAHAHYRVINSIMCSRVRM